MNTLVQKARELLARAQHVSVLTGAGVSAESGIPVFRGSSGLWNNFRAEDLATPHAFRKNPELVWQWYNWRRALVAKAQPNAGHQALAVLESRAPAFHLITQNVDGLHQAAGSRNILELHGSLWTLRCTRCGEEWPDRRLYESAPICQCGGLARPGVVWFGENLRPEIWSAAESAVRTSDVLLVVGTSAVVYPAAGLVPLAKSQGSTVVEVNLESAADSRWIDLSLTGPASLILMNLIE